MLLDKSARTTCGFDVTVTRLAICCLTLIAIVCLQIAFIGQALSTTCAQEPMNALLDTEPIRPPTHRRRRLPQAIIIGVRKGGTRALLDAMALHPMIKAARREVHFFDQNETYAQGVDWYRQQMPVSYEGQITVEKTPGYFACPLAPERVYRLNKKMKLILIVRDPVVRTVSDFTQVLYTKTERNKTLPSFEASAFKPGSDSIDTNYKPVKNSLYALHLEKWLRFFPLEQFLILDGDKFITDPLSQLRHVERFFKLPAAIAEDQLVFNAVKGFFCFRKREKRSARCLGTSKGRAHVPIAPLTQRALEKNFRPFNERFFQLVNQRFHNWCQRLC